MTLSSSGQAPQPANASQQAQGRGQWLVTASAICGSIAAGVSGFWLLAMELTAWALRPSELSAFPAYQGDVTPFQQAALTRMTAIVIGSFLAIMALAALAIILGRRARRQSSNGAAAASLEKWATLCLIVCLVGLGLLLLLGLSTLPVIESFLLRLPPLINEPLNIVLYRSPIIIQALIALTAASVMGCLILSGIVAHRGQRWRTPISLVVSALLLLAWFATTAWVARFIVGFYMHLVF